MFDPRSEPPPTSKLFTTFAKLALPNILTNLLGFLSNAVIIIYASRTDDSMNVAVMGLAATCCGLLVSSLVVGLNSAQETLTSQAFGANNLRLCGIYLNRGTFLLTAFFILLALIPSLFAE